VKPLYTNGRNAAFSLLQCEAHTLAFVQLAQTGMLNGADVNKNIVTAFIRGDKTIAFPGVEPFYNTGLHSGILPCLVFLHRFHLRTFFLTRLVPGTGSFFSTGSFLPVLQY